LRLALSARQVAEAARAEDGAETLTAMIAAVLETVAARAAAVG